MANQALRKLRRQKILLVLSIVIPAALSGYLTARITSRIYFDSDSITWIDKNRATVQIIVQIVSLILSACQIYGICSLATMSFNIQILSTPTSLDALKLWDALRLGRLDWDLPPLKLAILTLFIIVIQGPSALWTGAITPVPTTANITADFPIPNYSTFNIGLWGTPCLPATDCGLGVTGNVSELGTFSYIPWKTKTGLLLNSISQASSRDSSRQPQIDKLDNTGYIYNGRSYGVASTVGLVRSVPGAAQAQDKSAAFSYQEYGYRTAVKCMYNDTSALKLHEVEDVPIPESRITPTVVWANGSLPNGKWAGFPSWASFRSESVVALAANYTQKYMYGFVGGFYYANTAFGPPLNNIQCEVTFHPESFEVYVNTTTKSISVTSLGETVPQKDIDSSRRLVNTTFLSPSLMSQVLTTGYASIFGDAFKRNIENVRVRAGHGTPDDSDACEGVAEGLETLIDGFLGSTGAAQVMLNGESQTINASMTLRTMQLGEPTYTYSVLAVSLAIILLLVIEAARTKFWRDFPLFNLLDLKSAILGVAANGKRRLPEALANWGGDAACREVGSLPISVVIRKKGPVRAIIGGVSSAVRQSGDDIELLEFRR